MTLLKNERAFRKWKKQSCQELDPPVEYPCFVYTVVRSFEYEEETALYLYGDDLSRMTFQPHKATK